MTSFRAPKCTSLRGTTRFGPSLVQIWRTVRDLWPWQRKQKRNKKKRQWQTGYSPRPPTSPYRSQSLHAGWSPVYSSIFQVLLKSVLELWVVENPPSPLLWQMAYATACTTVQAVILYKVLLFTRVTDRQTEFRSVCYAMLVKNVSTHICN